MTRLRSSAVGAQPAQTDALLRRSVWGLSMMPRHWLCACSAPSLLAQPRVGCCSSRGTPGCLLGALVQPSLAPLLLSLPALKRSPSTAELPSCLRKTASGPWAVVQLPHLPRAVAPPVCLLHLALGGAPAIPAAPQRLLLALAPLPPLARR